MLNQAARIVLGIQCSSVASERVFSKAGLIVSDRRINLKPSTMNNLVFLNENRGMEIDEDELDTSDEDD